MKGRALGVFGFGMLAWAAAAAQSGPDNDPAQAQGYVQNQFHHTSFDSINLYNGQLTIPIAIGPAYQIGPSLAFQATLTYNTRLTEPGHPTDENNPNYFPLVGDPAIGIGWTFSAGKIACGALPTAPPNGIYAAAPCYVRPDGAQIDFSGGPSSWVTEDGSQYKLVRNGAAPNFTFTMWDGDGNRYDFTRVVQGYDDDSRVTPGYARDFGRGRDGYYLTSLQDPFGNRLTVTYAANGIAPCPSACTTAPLPVGSMRCAGTTSASWIPASFFVQRVGEASATEIGQIVTDPSLERIRTLRFRTFAGRVGQFSEWNLSYGAATLAARSASLYCATPVPLLTGLALPPDVAGTSGYAFTYHPGGSVGTALLKTMTLPTGATIYYDYGSYHFYHGRRALFSENDPCGPIPSGPPPSQGVRRSAIATSSGGPGRRKERDEDFDRYAPTQGPCLPYTDSRQYEQRAVGVLQRAVTGPGMADSVANYTQYSFPFGENGNTDAQTLTVVLLPADADGARRAESTLFWAAKPIVDPNAPPTPGDRLGADILHAVFEADPNPAPTTLISPPVCGGGADEDRLCATHAIRVTRQIFQYDLDGPGMPAPDADGKMRRLRSTTTWHGRVASGDVLASDLCPACPRHSVTSSLAGANTWEGNGRHYDRETHDGTLGGDRHEVTTVWTPQTGPNLLNLYASRIETDADIAAPANAFGSRNAVERSFFFDPATGFLRGSLVWDASSSRYAAECRYGDAAGNVADAVTATVVSAAGKPVTNPCYSRLADFPAGVIGGNDDAFGQNTLYSAGRLASRRWLKDQTPLSWYSYRVSRDGATGAIDVSYDTAGLSTVFSYDSQGRVTSIAPPSEAATVITYSDPRTTTAVRTGSDDASWQRTFYDGLGRLVREIRQMPSGYGFRTHAFDPAGHESFTSEWKACGSVAATGDCAIGAAGSGTTFSSFDPFGRAQMIRKADGSVTTLTFTDGATPYSDTRKAVSVANVGCVWNGSACMGGAPATTAYRYDAFGRLGTVLEPGGDITTYAYDVAGKLVSVAQGSQTRTFAYDALGYLMRETTPEAGIVDYTAVSGGKTYSFYGSLGNLRGRVDASGSDAPVTRSYRYDSAGRSLCEIAGSFSAGRTCDSSGLSLYVRNFYDGQGFAGGTYPGGRLTQRLGYNRGLTPTATVTEQFAYSAPSGKLSQQTTSTVAGTFTHSAAQSWTYDSLGLVRTHGLPRASGTFTLTNGRASGYITSVGAPSQSVVSAATYAASGALASWTAGNGVVTTITPDATLLPRTAQIRTSGAVATAAGGNFDSGAFRYDGAGNIVAMGSDAFAYDPRSRLTSVSYAGVGAEAYAYDRFGNLTSDATTAYCPSSCAGNRLGAPFAYDARGNLKATASETLTYDDLSRQIRHQAPGADWRYLYSGASERVAKLPGGGTLQYTYRDESHRIATEYFGTTLARDNMYLGNLLVASYVSSSLAGTPGWEFYASDHLATPRLVTNLAGQVIDSRKYWPYGAGVPGNAGTLQKLRFCAMERDSENGHYYDHARIHDAGIRRFTSVDTVGGSAESPQSWNRYAYVLGNPLKHVDPDGKLTIVVPGTFARGNADFRPGGVFFQAVAQSVHDRAVTSLQWSGGDSHRERLEGAKALVQYIKDYKFAPGEKLNIIAHSHGGNLAIAAINLGLGRPVDNLVTLGTPSRDGYRLEEPSDVRNWVNVFNSYDQVQIRGGGDFNSPFEFGGAARTHPYAHNVDWDVDFGPFGSHEALHSPSAWDFVLPRLELEKQPVPAQ